MGCWEIQTLLGKSLAQKRLQKFYYYENKTIMDSGGMTGSLCHALLLHISRNDEVKLVQPLHRDGDWLLPGKHSLLVFLRLISNALITD